MHLKIEKQFAIIKKEIGKYHSFPSIIKQHDRLWMACRTGSVSNRQDHGDQGKVRLFYANHTTPEHWEFYDTLFEPSENGTLNELDAILSQPEPDLVFLATRDYKWKERNNVYLSMGQTPELRQRIPLAKISDQYIICFGHIRKTINKDLLMPGYSGFSDEPIGTPILMVSTNNGQTWSFRAKVASSSQVGTRLTEYSLGHLGGSNWIALIRNETPPNHLYQTISHNDGCTWSAPQTTELCGHAPMILDFKSTSGSDYGHLVLYRDLSDADPGVSIGMSLDQGNNWKQIGRLASYQGSIYDGGYGDVVQLENNCFFAVYYLCDEDNSPWIEGSIFHLE